MKPEYKEILIKNGHILQAAGVALYCLCAGFCLFGGGR